MKYEKLPTPTHEAVREIDLTEQIDDATLEYDVPEGDMEVPIITITLITGEELTARCDTEVVMNDSTVHYVGEITGGNKLFPLHRYRTTILVKIIFDDDGGFDVASLTATPVPIQ